MTEQIRIGDRVEANNSSTPIEGIVLNIQVEQSRTGWVPVMTVGIDLRNGEAVSPNEEITTPAGFWRPKGSTTEPMCSACGYRHSDDIMKSERFIEMYERYKGASDEGRRDVMLEMATHFVDILHDTNTMFAEEMHDLVRDVREASSDLDGAWAKLGRALVLTLSQHEHHEQNQVFFRVAQNQPRRSTVGSN